MGTPRRPMTGPKGKPCGTPGAIYSSALAGKKITLEIELPIYLQLSEKKQTAMFDHIHNHLLLAIEDVYREYWSQFAGKTLDDSGPMPKSYSELFKNYMRQE